MTVPRSGGTRTAAEWAVIRERVDALGRAVTGELRVSPEETRRVLEERARALAVPLASTERDGSLELVLFELAEEVYALEARFVIEVGRPAEVAPLPGAEPPLVGIVAWRGELLGLLDLRRILGITASGGAEPAQLMVLGEAGSAFGVRVDAVRGLETIPTAALRPPPGGSQGERGLLRGITSQAVLVLAAEELIRTHA